jgi:NAD(P)-dependent dehydrogenase (short-subunit alcohol dehydrogenase family)
MTTPTEQHVAIVTGGAGGLGQAIVARLRDDGLQVAAADLHGADVSVDVTDPGSTQAMFEDVRDRFGRVDVLVNGAGIAGPTAPVTDYPPDAWRQVIDVNLVGTFNCMRACLPSMVERGYGRVVNIASIAGQDPNPNMSAYSASKAGVIALTKSAARELARSGVFVNALVPGVIDAGLTHHTASGEERELFKSRVPMGRMGRPDELAELVSWMASPRCSFSTGATFDLSGGRAVT